jgi:hypothetical protein
LPRREVLETLARRYHHLQNEHKRAGPESVVRRRIGERLLDVGERFDNEESPPWEHAAELLADGLIHTNAALTPTRPARALAPSVDGA